MTSTYDSQTLEASEDFVNYYAWVLHRVSDAIHGRTLEIGSGTGTMSERVAPFCSEMVLVEPAANLCSILDDRFANRPDVSVRHGSLDDLMGTHVAELEAPFDTIVSFNVLEHIEDDVGTLRSARTLLGADGRLVLFVPSVPFLYGAVDAQVDHLRRYTKRSLTNAIETAGFKVERIEYLDFLGMVPWFIQGRVLRKTTTGGGVRGYDRFVIPVCRAFDRLIGPPVGKNLIAIARP